MAFNLRNRNFLKELDFTKEELVFLLNLSKDLKNAKYAGTDIKMDGVEYKILSIKDALAVLG